MSVLMRPEGDIVAQNYGEYFPLDRIKDFRKGDRYEVLCRDGLNYIAEVKYFNTDTLQGHLHFLFWKTRFDYKGSFEHVYFTSEGQYSTAAGINVNNQYEVPNATGSKQKQSAKTKRSPNVVNSSYALNTKYDQDFFAKPRPAWAKKRSSNMETPTVPLEKIDESDESDTEEDNVEAEEDPDEPNRKKLKINDSNNSGSIITPKPPISQLPQHALLLQALIGHAPPAQKKEAAPRARAAVAPLSWASVKVPVDAVSASSTSPTSTKSETVSAQSQSASSSSSSSAVHISDPTPPSEPVPSPVIATVPLTEMGIAVAEESISMAALIDLLHLKSSLQFNEDALKYLSSHETSSEPTVERIRKLIEVRSLIDKSLELLLS